MSDPQPLKNSTAIVTGGGRGIGAATAQALAKLGCRVACVSRTEAEILGVAKAIQEQGGQALAVTCDVQDRAAVEAMVKQAEQGLGPVDILVNNAGWCEPCTLVDMSDEVFSRTMDGNMTSTFLCCRAVVGGMIKEKRGCIVNVASISGVRGSSKFPGFTAYAAAKAAVIVFSEALAAELADHKIRVNAISPGAVDTKMLRDVAPGVEPGMSAEEVAQSIVQLIQARAINGSNLEIFG
jgi:NAD(P)-dependent dehydrogenase (short-subunit alcohol dehydrogenase family)